MKTSLFYVLTVVLLLWLQIALNYFVSHMGFAADVVLVGVLYFGLSRGPLAGQMLGFLWGLLIDSSSLGTIGLHALLYAAAGFFSGMLRRQLDEKKVWTQTIFTFGISFFYVVVYFLLDRLFSPAPHPLSWSMAAQPFINGLIAPLIFWGLERWAQLWDLMPLQE